MHVVGGQQHHLLLLREVVMEDAVQQAFPLELPGWAQSGGYREPPPACHAGGNSLQDLWPPTMPSTQKSARWIHHSQVNLPGGISEGMEQGDRNKCRAQGRWGAGGSRLGTRSTHCRGDALQLTEGHFVVHAANIPPHIIVLRHCDLQGVGMAVTTPLPTLGMAQGQGTGMGHSSRVRGVTG